MISRIFAIFALLASPAFAENHEASLSEGQLVVLACLERMDAEAQPTEWSQCVNLIFEPCATEAVGSEAHLACLEDRRGDWGTTVEDLQTQVTEKITPEGVSTLADLLAQWSGYVVQKCGEVALEKAGISAKAAQLGCEVTEMVGLTGEYAACLEGRSAAPYCVFPQ